MKNLLEVRLFDYNCQQNATGCMLLRNLEAGTKTLEKSTQESSVEVLALRES